MPRSTAIATALQLPALLLLAASVQAQAIRGTLVERGTGRPIEGAFVVLLDADGRQAGAGFSNRDGFFEVRAPAPGRFVLRADRIGYHTTTSGILELAAGQVLEHRLEVPIFAIPLVGIQVERERRCVVRPAQGLATARVWDEARKALAAAAWVERERRLRFELIRYERDLEPDRLRVTRETSRSAAGIGERPYVSLPAESLAAGGYVRSRSDGVYYHAPDAHALLSDAFLDTHCMRLTNGRGDRRGLIGLAFEPVRGRTLPEIAGTFWLDRQTAALRSLEYRYVNLDLDVPTDRLGGRVDFEQLPGGAWIVRQWWIRMPMIGVYETPLPGGRVRQDRGLIGIREEGGEVVRVESASVERVLDAARAVLIGAVLDSTRMTPLAGARVYLSGTPYEATTGADGTFEFASLPEGEYDVAFFHPRLDSLPGFTLPTRPVALPPGGRASVDLAVPPLRRILAESCPPLPPGEPVPGAVPGEGLGILVGRVRDERTGEPVPGATVSLAWSRSRLDVDTTVADRVRPVRGQPGRASPGRIEEQPWTNRLETDAHGRFWVCRLPASVPVTIVARTRSRESDSVEVRVEAERLTWTEIVLTRRR